MPSAHEQNRDSSDLEDERLTSQLHCWQVTSMVPPEEKQKLPWVYRAIVRFLYGYLPAALMSVVIYAIHWKHQEAISHDSFTGFALFYVAPMYFAIVLIGNTWVLFVPTMNKALIFLAGLVIPIGFFFF